MAITEPENLGNLVPPIMIAMEIKTNWRNESMNRTLRHFRQLFATLGSMDGPGSRPRIAPFNPNLEARRTDGTRSRSFEKCVPKRSLGTRVNFLSRLSCGLDSNSVHMN